MTPAQLTKYRVVWSQCRAALQAAGKPHDDRARMALHERAIGRACSSKDFTNHEFDMVLAAMMAIAKPADFAAQMRQQEQPELRREDIESRIDDALHVIIPRSGCNSDAHAVHARASYRSGLARRMFGTGMSADLTERQLQKLMGVLEREATKREKARATTQPTEPAPF